MKSQFFIVVILIAFAAVLRIPGLDKQPLWTDEANCLAIAQGKGGGVWQALQRDCSPPLYYWLLAAVVGKGRPPEAQTRLLSVILGILAVPLLGFFGRHLMGRHGWIAGGLLAISPLHVWHSQEARMYTLVLLLGAVLAFLTVLTRAEPSRSRLACLSLTQVFLLWTHHFSLFPAAVSWAMLLFGPGRVPLTRARPYLLVVLIGWIPVGWLLAVQSFAYKTGSWLPPPSWSEPLRSVGLWISGVEGDVHTRVRGIPLALAASGVGALYLGIRGLWSRVGRLSALFSAGGLTAAFLVSFVIPAYTPGRYDVSLLPAFLLLLAAGWVRSPPWARVASGALICLGASLGLIHCHLHYEKGAMAELVELLEERERPGDSIVIVPEVEAPVFNYYYEGSSKVLIPPSFTRVETVDYTDYSSRWEDESEARNLALRCWRQTDPKGRILLLYSPYKQTEHFKGWLMLNAGSFDRIIRRVTGSGSTELSLLERATADDNQDGLVVSGRFENGK